MINETDPREFWTAGKVWLFCLALDLAIWAAVAVLIWGCL